MVEAPQVKPRITGTIKFLKLVEGYGFIARDDRQRDVFVHIEDLRTSSILMVNAGLRVSFDLTDDGKGPRAVNLKEEPTVTEAMIVAGATEIEEKLFVSPDDARKAAVAAFKAMWLAWQNRPRPAQNA